MFNLHLPLAIFPASLMILSASAAFAQEYPSKAIRIVTASVGGGGDFNSRFIAQGISGPLGQPVVVANVGGGVIPTVTLVKSPPDGYTLMVQSSNAWVTPFFEKSLPYDLKDLVPVSLISKAPSMLVVHPSLPVKSVKELIALAKAKPGELNMSSGPLGSTGYVEAEFFKAMARINVARIPYSSNSLETSDLMSGQIQMAFGSVGSIGPQVKAGRVRAIAVTSPNPSLLLPNLPTVASVVPGFQSESFYGMFVPIKTPEAIVRRLSQEVVRYVNTPAAKQFLLKNDLEAVGSSPEEFAALIKSEVARFDKLINVDKVLQAR